MGILFGTLVTGQTGTGVNVVTGPNQKPGVKTFHVQVSGSGAVSANVAIMGSNLYSTANSSVVAGRWVLLGTVVISGTTVISDGFAAQSPWKNYLSNVLAISGSGASIDIGVGEDGT